MRKNAGNERKLIFLAIENITNTPTARKYARGAAFREIKEYTKLPSVAVDRGIFFLLKHGLIHINKKCWFIRHTPLDNFCWWHGLQDTIGGKCKKCFDQDGR